MFLIESYNVLCFIFSKICIALFYCALIPWIYRLVDKNFFLFPRKTNYMQMNLWTDILHVTWLLSADFFFTLVDKLHICVLLICFNFFCALSYYLFIHVRKTWTRKYTYTLLELKSGNIRNLFYRKNHNKTLDLDIFFLQHPVTKKSTFLLQVKCFLLNGTN